MKKKLLIGLLAVVMCFALTGCGDKESTNPNNDDNKQQEQNENNNDNSLGVGKYKVEKSENSILVITNDGSAISTTEYKFSGGTLTSAVLTQKYSSSALAKTMYDTMKNEPTITNQYVGMNLKSDTITMNLKNEILSVYNGMDQNEIYNLMYETYSMYME